jgi:hypothetical protein
MRWEGHIARLEEGRAVYKVLVSKPEEKIPLWRPRRRWEDNIKMDPQEVGCGAMDWIELAQDRDRWRAPVNVVMVALFWFSVRVVNRCYEVSDQHTDSIFRVTLWFTWMFKW